MEQSISVQTEGCMNSRKAAFWPMNCSKKQLNKQGYCQNKLVLGLCSHRWHTVQFTLLVDKFEVKYVGEEHIKHLRETLEKDYKETTERDEKICIGIILDWDYMRSQVHLSILGYI